MKNTSNDKRYVFRYSYPLFGADGSYDIIQDKKENKFLAGYALYCLVCDKSPSYSFKSFETLNDAVDFCIKKTTSA